MIETLEKIIGEHPFFKGMAEKHIQFIASCARNVRYDEGQVIFREGDPADQFYFVREGLVAVELMIPQRGFTTVQTVAAGEMLGWSWLISPYRWHFERAHAPSHARLRFRRANACAPSAKRTTISGTSC